MRPKLSIIVPIYNVELYLRQCLDSILAQTYQDFELLLVDDGTPDNSGKICDEYSHEDNRIRALHKPNGGVSSARNFGLDQAIGEWVTFIDADDFISSTFIEALMKVAIECTDLDFVQAGCINWADDKILGINQQYEDFKGSDKGKLFRDFRGLVFSKLFRLENINHGIDAHPIRFDERMKIAEDMAFTLDYLLTVKTYAFISETGYYYRRDNETSATHSKNNFDYERDLHSFRHIKNSFERLILYHNLSKNAFPLRLFQICDNLQNVVLSLYFCDYNRRERIKHLKCDLTKSEINYLNYSSNKLKWILFSFLRLGLVSFFDLLMKPIIYSYDKYKVI